MLISPILIVNPSLQLGNGNIVVDFLWLIKWMSVRLLDSKYFFKVGIKSYCNCPCCVYTRKRLKLIDTLFSNIFCFKSYSKSFKQCAAVKTNWSFINTEPQLILGLSSSFTFDDTGGCGLVPTFLTPSSLPKFCSCALGFLPPQSNNRLYF